MNDIQIQSFLDTEVINDRIRGSLFGGAAGDALGYAVEFLDENEIISTYGVSGITEYQLNPESKKAEISDDTQMSLFTANGLLVGYTDEYLHGIQKPIHTYVKNAYLDWLRTQEMTYIQSRQYKTQSWLSDVPELYSRRAPGHTCLTALKNPYDGPLNNSKGCGGIMRIAPLALSFHHTSINTLDKEGAVIAGLTHGHSLGQIPAAVLTHIINRIIFAKKRMSLKEIIIEAQESMWSLFEGDPYLQELNNTIEQSLALSKNDDKDIDNIHRIGDGWVAEETLGIALYCSLRHQNDFSSGIIAAVNHKGDSDSTGAITGNILGALLGLQAIDEKWKKDLELSDVILEIANDLFYSSQMSKNNFRLNPDWKLKYIDMHRVQG